MASSYTPNRSYELVTTGEQTNTWGVTLNSAVFSIIDLNLGGRLALDCAGSSDVTLTSTQARNLVIECTGVLTGNINVIVPNAGAFFFVHNATTGAFTLSVKPSGGAAIIVPQGQRMLIFANPTSAAAEIMVPGVVPISPAQITSNQNDYAPTGYSNANEWRLTSDASRNITGITAGGLQQDLTLINVGSNPIVLVDASASSSAANRFSFGSDFVLSAGASVMLIYDFTTARWRRKIFASANGGAWATVQVFTAAGTPTWTKPTGCRAVWVRVRGSGGGGGGATGAASNASMGAGGGQGEYAEKWIASGLGTTETVTIGAGGAGGAAAASPNAGSNGNTSSFGSHVTAAGGSGGATISASTSGNGCLGGSGGTGGSGGDIQIKGAMGDHGARYSGTAAISGNGGGDGGGKGVQNADTNGNAGVRGGGGSGATSVSTNQRAGGDGGDGWCIVEEFY